MTKAVFGRFVWAVWQISPQSWGLALNELQKDAGLRSKIWPIRQIHRLDCHTGHYLLTSSLFTRLTGRIIAWHESQSNELQLLPQAIRSGNLTSWLTVNAWAGGGSLTRTSTTSPSGGGRKQQQTAQTFQPSLPTSLRNPHEDHLERCLPPTQPPPIPPQTKALETWAFPATYPLTYLQKWRFSNRIIPTGSLAETFFNFPEDLTSRSRSDCRIHGILKSSVGDGNKSHGIHVWYIYLHLPMLHFNRLGTSLGIPNLVGPPSHKRDPYHSQTSYGILGSKVWEMGGPHPWGSLEFALNRWLESSMVVLMWGGV